MFGGFIGLGYISVPFFFVLSGYVLAVVYLQVGERMDTRKFLWARFARIYPLYFVMLVVATPLLLLPRIGTYGLKMGVLKTAVTFLANAVMAEAWIPRMGSLNNPGWSLSVETLFYISFPIIGFMLWRLRGRRIWVVALLIYLGGVALVWFAAPYLPSDLKNLFPILHLPTFALGILLARWQQEARLRPQTGSMGHAKVYAALIAGAAVILCRSRVERKVSTILVHGCARAGFLRGNMGSFERRDLDLPAAECALARDSWRGQLWTLSHPLPDTAIL